ncbi:MAG: hypothetical protein K9K21_02895 [Desulfotignum sp.]|nr:hypothetical protein [Desulfotignum sp.]
MDLLNEWVEIFRAGEHVSKGGQRENWGEADLDEIVRNYNSKEAEAPLVAGYPKDNDPAYGWVEGLKRAGSILLAKFKQVQPDFARAVREGRYKKRSISLLPGNHLRHVGFIGVEVAIPGLADLSCGGQTSDSLFIIDMHGGHIKNDFSEVDDGLPFSSIDEFFKRI